MQPLRSVSQSRRIDWVIEEEEDRERERGDRICLKTKKLLKCPESEIDIDKTEENNCGAARDQSRNDKEYSNSGASRLPTKYLEEGDSPHLSSATSR